MESFRFKTSSILSILPHINQLRPFQGIVIPNLPCLWHKHLHVCLESLCWKCSCLTLYRSTTKSQFWFHAKCQLKLTAPSFTLHFSPGLCDRLVFFTATLVSTHICPHFWFCVCVCVFVFLGAVPVPESLLFSPPPLVPLKHVSTEHLLESVSPAEVEELRKTCKGNMMCVHDTLASGSSDMGLQTLDAKKQFQNLALIYGKLSALL